MKKIILMLLIFLLSLSVAGKDKINIICSPLGGYSMLPETEYQISYMNSDGSVKWQKLNRVLQEIANAGANMWREFPPWILNQLQYETLAPFKFVNNEMVLNPRYFTNLRKIARLAKGQYSLTLIYDLFNASETRIRPVKNHSPWKKFPGYFYNAPARHLAKYIDAVLSAHQGLGVWYQLCNEPSFEYPEFMAFAYSHLIEKGIPPERILLGYDMRLKHIGGIHEAGYRKFRGMVVAKLGKQYEIKIKTLSWSPFHGTSHESLIKYWGNETSSGGQRREIFSLDGRRLPNRPGESESYTLFKRIFKIKSRKVKLGKIGCEVIYGKEAGINPMAQLRGLIRAYEECLYHTPVNKGKYLKPLPLPSWLGEEKPEPEKPSITSVKIEYSMDNGNSWTVIVPSRTDPGSPMGPWKIKISEVDGNLADTWAAKMKREAGESGKNKTALLLAGKIEIGQNGTVILIDFMGKSQRINIGTITDLIDIRKIDKKIVITDVNGCKYESYDLKNWKK